MLSALSGEAFYIARQRPNMQHFPIDRLECLQCNALSGEAFYNCSQHFSHCYICYILYLRGFLHLFPTFVRALRVMTLWKPPFAPRFYYQLCILCTFSRFLFALFNFVSSFQRFFGNFFGHSTFVRAPVLWHCESGHLQPRKVPTNIADKKQSEPPIWSNNCNSCYKLLMAK